MEKKRNGFRGVWLAVIAFLCAIAIGVGVFTFMPQGKTGENSLDGSDETNITADAAVSYDAAMNVADWSSWTELGGSTSSKTLSGGSYKVTSNTTISGGIASAGLEIVGTVNIYVKEGVTLTCTGGGGSGTWGGGAGILLPSTAILNLYGKGTVKAYGGDGANGSNGEEGGYATQDGDFSSGSSGAGGAGGGGAGAGIGTSGGRGSDGGSSKSGVSMTHSTDSPYGADGNDGNSGINGSAASDAGTLNIYIMPATNVIATGGSRGYGGYGGSGSKRWAQICDDNGKADLNAMGSSGTGGGGGGGGAGSQFGAGGSGGGGGGSGGTGGGLKTDLETNGSGDNSGWYTPLCGGLGQGGTGGASPAGTRGTDGQQGGARGSTFTVNCYSHRNGDTFSSTGERSLSNSTGLTWHKGSTQRLNAQGGTSRNGGRASGYKNTYYAGDGGWGGNSSSTGGGGTVNVYSAGTLSNSGNASINNVKSSTIMLSTNKGKASTELTITPTTTQYTYYAGATSSSLLTGDAPVLPGYDFKGYYTQANGEGEQAVTSDFAWNSNFYFPLGTTTIYAYFTPKTYKVYYYTNFAKPGGSYQTGVTNSVGFWATTQPVFDSGDWEIASISNPVDTGPVRVTDPGGSTYSWSLPGYKLKGWATSSADAAAGTVKYGSGVSGSKRSDSTQATATHNVNCTQGTYAANQYLYAVWETKIIISNSGATDVPVAMNGEISPVYYRGTVGNIDNTGSNIGVNKIMQTVSITGSDYDLELLAFRQNPDGTGDTYFGPTGVKQVALEDATYNFIQVSSTNQHTSALTVYATWVLTTVLDGNDWDYSVGYASTPTVTSGKTVLVRSYFNNTFASYGVEKGVDQTGQWGQKVGSSFVTQTKFVPMTRVGYTLKGFFFKTGNAENSNNFEGDCLIDDEGAGAASPILNSPELLKKWSKIYAKWDATLFDIIIDWNTDTYRFTASGVSIDEDTSMFGITGNYFIAIVDQPFDKEFIGLTDEGEGGTIKVPVRAGFVFNGLRYAGSNQTIIGADGRPFAGKYFRSEHLTDDKTAALHLVAQWTPLLYNFTTTVKGDGDILPYRSVKIVRASSYYVNGENNIDGIYPESKWVAYGTAYDNEEQYYINTQIPNGVYIPVVDGIPYVHVQYTVSGADFNMPLNITQLIFYSVELKILSDGTYKVQFDFLNELGDEALKQYTPSVTVKFWMHRDYKFYIKGPAKSETETAKLTGHLYYINGSDQSKDVSDMIAGYKATVSGPSVITVSCQSIISNVNIQLNTPQTGARVYDYQVSMPGFVAVMEGTDNASRFNGLGYAVIFSASEGTVSNFDAEETFKPGLFYTVKITIKLAGDNIWDDKNKVTLTVNQQTVYSDSTYPDRDLLGHKSMWFDYPSAQTGTIEFEYTFPMTASQVISWEKFPTIKDYVYPGQISPIQYAIDGVNVFQNGTPSHGVDGIKEGYAYRFVDHNYLDWDESLAPENSTSPNYDVGDHYLIVYLRETEGHTALFACIHYVITPYIINVTTDMLGQAEYTGANLKSNVEIPTYENATFKVPDYATVSEMNKGEYIKVGPYGYRFTAKDSNVKFYNVTTDTQTDELILYFNIVQANISFRLKSDYSIVYGTQPADFITDIKNNHSTAFVITGIKNGTDNLSNIFLSTTGGMENVAFYTNYNASNHAVGEYRLGVEGGLESKNYIVTFVESSFSVTRATLTATVGSVEMNYGQDAASIISAATNVDGFEWGEQYFSVFGATKIFTTNYSGTIGNSGGGYQNTFDIKLNPQAQLLATNYTISPTMGALTVKKGELIVTPIGEAIRYGDARPDFRYTITGYIPGESKDDLYVNSAQGQAFEVAINCEYNTSDPARRHAGEYPITVSGYDETENYKVTYRNTYDVGGEPRNYALTVTPVTVHVKIEGRSIRYGDPVPDLFDWHCVEGDFITDWGDSQATAVDYSSVTFSCTYSSDDSSLRGVGSFNITMSGLQNKDYKNYVFDYQTTAKLQVTARTLTITNTTNTIQYGETNLNLVYAFEGGGYDDEITDIRNKITYLIKNGDINMNVADLVVGTTYTLVFNCTSDYVTQGRYVINWAGTTLNLITRQLYITGTSYILDYGDAVPPRTGSITNALDKDKAAIQDLLDAQTDWFRTNYTPTTNAGSDCYMQPIENTIRLALGDDIVNNYQLIFTPGTITVRKLTITVRADGTGTYGTDFNADDLILSLVNDDPDYKLPNEQRVTTIGAKYSFDLGGYVGAASDVNNYTVTITVENPDGLVNYEIITAQGFLVINKRQVKVTVEGPYSVFYYGTALDRYNDLVLTFDTVGNDDVNTGMIGTDETEMRNFILGRVALGYDLSNYDDRKVGDYEIEFDDLTHKNYAFNPVSGKKLTVAPITIKMQGTTSADNDTIDYGDAAPAYSAKIVAGPIESTFAYYDDVNELVNNTTYTCDYTQSLTSANSYAGTYFIKKSYSCTSERAGSYIINYDDNAKLTVNKISLTVKVKDVALTYGDAKKTNADYELIIPELSGIPAAYSADETIAGLGFVLGENSNVTFTCAYDPNTENRHVGISYPITASIVGHENEGRLRNYNVTISDGHVTVGQYAITITAPTFSVVYGVDASLSAENKLTWSHSFFILDSELTELYQSYLGGFNVANPGSRSAKDYETGVKRLTLTEEQSKMAGNYSITPVPGTLTVTQANLEIIPNSVTVTYGAKVPDLTFNYVGLQYKDDPTENAEINRLGISVSLTTTYTQGKGVGEYSITANYTGASTNYTITKNAAQKVTVVARHITLTVVDKTITYGDSKPAYALTNAFVTVGVSNKDILLNGDDVSLYATDNFGKALTGGRLTVQDETAGLLHVKEGGYTVVLNGVTAANYAISYVSGNLTVNQKTLHLKLKAPTEKIYYGQQIGKNELAVAITESDFVSTDSISSLGINVYDDFTFFVYSLNGSTEREYAAGETTGYAGSYFVRITSNVALNDYVYDIDNSVTIKVEKRPVTIKTGNYEEVYGTAFTLNDVTLTFEKKEGIEESGVLSNDQATLIATINRAYNGTEYIGSTGASEINRKAGDYTFSFSASVSHDLWRNYDCTIENGKLTITQKSGLVITIPTTYTVEYKQAFTMTTDLFTVENFAYSEDVAKLLSLLKLSTTYHAGDFVGEGDLANGNYSFTASYDGVSGINLSYKDITITTGEIEVTKIALTVKVNDAVATYGDDAPAFTYDDTVFNGQELAALKDLFKKPDGTSFTNDPFVEVIKTNYNKDDANSRDAGTYDIFFAESDILSTCYEITCERGTLTVDKLHVTYQATLTTLQGTKGDNTLIYGMAFHTKDVQLSLKAGSAYVYGENGDDLVWNIRATMDGTDTDYNTSSPNTCSVGKFILTVATSSIPAALDKNYIFECENGAFMVVARDIVVRTNTPEIYYGTEWTVNDPTLTVSYMPITAVLADPNSQELENTGLIEMDRALFETNVKPVIKCGYSTATADSRKVGDYTFTYTYQEGTLKNYNVQFALTKLVVNKASGLIITSLDKTVEYGTAITPNLFYEFEITGAKFDDAEGSTNGSAINHTSKIVWDADNYAAEFGKGNVGKHDIKFTSTSDRLDNYENVEYRYGTLTVTKATLTYTIANKEITYGEAKPANADYVVKSITGMKYTEENDAYFNDLHVGKTDHSLLTFETGYDEEVVASRNVGNYFINVSNNDLGELLSNYVIVIYQNEAEPYNGNHAILTVKKAELTVTVEASKSITYGTDMLTVTTHLFDKNKINSLTFSGFVYNEDTNELPDKFLLAVQVDGNYLQSAEKLNVNTAGYNVTAQYDAINDLANYKVTVNQGKLIITAKTLTITATSDDIVYGTSQESFEAHVTVTYSGFVADEDERALGVALGDKIIDKSSVTGYKGYNASLTGQRGVGEYQLRVVVGDDGYHSTNYDIVVAVYNFTVTAKKLYITTTSEDIVYGTLNDDLYDIAKANVQFLDAEGNNGFAFDDNESSIGKLVLNTSTGYYNSDEPNQRKVGTYKLAAIKLDVYSLNGYYSDNYDIEIKATTFNVTKAPLTVTIENASIVYGENNPANTFYRVETAEGWQYNDEDRRATLLDENITYTTGYDVAVKENRHVGDYKIFAEITTESAIANYEVEFVEQGEAGNTSHATLRVTARPLTINVDNATREYGERLLSTSGPNWFDPELVGKIVFGGYDEDGKTGLMAFDENAGFKTLFYVLVTIGTENFKTADKLNVGSYATSVGYNVTNEDTVNWVKNYTIASTGGTLEITAKTLTIKATSNDIVYGTSQADFEAGVTVTYSPFAWNEDASIFGFEKAVFDTDSSDAYNADVAARRKVATYTIRVDQAAYQAKTANYAIEINDGAESQFNVTAKKLYITTTSEDIVYGTLNDDLYTTAAANITFLGEDGKDGFVFGDTKDSIGTLILNKSAGYYDSDDATGTQRKVGTYKLAAVKGDDGYHSDNYDIEIVPTNFNVTKAVLTVTVQDVVITYGDERPEISDTNELTASNKFAVKEAEGWKYNDETDSTTLLNKNITYNTGYDRGVKENRHVGDYNITAVITSESTIGNYEVKFVEQGEEGNKSHATLTVNQKELTIKVSDETIKYGEAIVEADAPNWFLAKLGEISFDGMTDFDADDDFADLFHLTVKLGDDYYRTAEKLNKGTYTTSVWWNVDDSNVVTWVENYKVNPIAKGTLTVEAVQLTIKVTHAPMEYGTSQEAYEAGLEVHFDGFVWNEDASALKGVFKIDSANPDTYNAAYVAQRGVTAVGSDGYALRAVLGETDGGYYSDNYDLVVVDQYFKVTAKTLYIIATSDNIAYGTSNAELWSGTTVKFYDEKGLENEAALVFGDDSLSDFGKVAYKTDEGYYNSEMAARRRVGTYKIEVKIASSADDSEAGNGYFSVNYNLVPVVTTETEFEVTKVILTVTLKDVTITYGDAMPERSTSGVEALANEFGVVDVVGFKYSDDEANKNVWFVDNSNFVYETTYSTGDATTRKVGKYQITAHHTFIDSAFALNNYTIEYTVNGDDNNATLTVVQKELRVTLSDLTITYGDSILNTVQTAIATIVNGTQILEFEGFVNEWDPELAAKAELYVTINGVKEKTPKKIEVKDGGYTIGIDIDESLFSNYTWATVSGTKLTSTLTVEKAAMTITASTPNVTYGITLEDFEAGVKVLYQGWKWDDEKEKDADGLYTAFGTTRISFLTAYGAGDNDDDKPTAKVYLDANGTHDVGTYRLVASELAANNYEITFVMTRFKVEQASLKITVGTFENIIYGDEFVPGSKLQEADLKDNVGLLTAEGLQYQDTLNDFGMSYLAERMTTLYDITIASQRKVGTYWVRIDGVADPDRATVKNYSITYVEGNVTVDPATLSVFMVDINEKQPGDTVDTVYAQITQLDVDYGVDASKLFASSVTGFKYDDKMSTGVVRSGSFRYVTTFDATNADARKVLTNAFYTVTPDGYQADNYVFDYVTCQLNVLPIALRVTAKNYQITYGDVLPEFEVLYRGFVYGENADNLAGALEVTVENESYDKFGFINKGGYTLIADGLESTNYTITYVNGSLEVLAMYIDAPQVLGTTYTGNPYIPEVPVSDYYEVVENNGGTNVGTYKVVLSIKEDYWANVMWASQRGNGDKATHTTEVTYTIEKGLFTVTFIQEGGTLTDGSSEIKVLMGETVRKSDMPVYERTGFVFDGWYLDSAYITVFRADATPIESNMTLYGKWTRFAETLAGRVIVAAEEGTPAVGVADATVTVVAPRVDAKGETQEVISVVTNGEGYFSLDGIAAGYYNFTVVFTSNGFTRTKTCAFTVTGEEDEVILIEVDYEYNINTSVSIDKLNNNFVVDGVEAMLTAADKEVLNSRGTVDLAVNVTETEQKRVNDVSNAAALIKKDVKGYFTVTATKSVLKASGQVVATNVTESEGLVTVTVKLGEENSNKKNYVVFRGTDGNDVITETVNGDGESVTYNAEDNTLTLKVKTFGDFAIGYDTEGIETVQWLPITIAVGVVAIAAIVCFALAAKALRKTKKAAKKA